MIQKIVMRNCATYNYDGVTLNCNKINFIYGHNGSGKSTISNYLQDPTNTFYSDCDLVWELGTDADILVYNKTFREKNLQSSDMPGVFTLGETTSEQLKQLGDLKLKHESSRNELIYEKANLKNKEQILSNLISSFEEDVWKAVLKKNEKDFNEAFKGFRNNKSNFAKQLMEYYKSGVTTNKTRDELKQQAATLFGTRPQKIQELSLPDYQEIIKIEKNSIWNTVIIGSDDVDIAKLINSLNISDWVRDGQEYIKGSNVCPFCQKKTIDSNLRLQFEKYFSEEFKQQIKSINDYYDEYQRLISRCESNLDSILQTVSDMTISIDIETLKNSIRDIQDIFHNNIRMMESKKAEPSRQFVLQESVLVFSNIMKILEDFNTTIRKHNEMVEDYEGEHKKLVESVWALCIAENQTIISNYYKEYNNTEKAKNGISKKVSDLEQRIKQLEIEIKDKNSKITGVQATADAINNLLKLYGYEGFRIVQSDTDHNRYQIKRPNGDIANDTLSEGEETFISFLYFLYRTQGGSTTEDISRHKVIVIDDPICSLDSSVLFVVSFMIKDIIQNAKNNLDNIDQVFVLTHNVYFHKEVSFIDGRNQTDRQTEFWILSKKDEITRCKYYGDKNPINTSYALLWTEVRDDENISTISLCNAMRRILENFFGTIGNAGIDTILKKFTSKEEQAICRSLFSWINDGSHSIPDDLYFGDYIEINEKYKKIFKTIFYATNNEYHYEMMMKRV